ncbi:MAG: cellulose biosynthesis cyclic di-GMP-binding regulatory protein BcsB [Thermovirgaceae bacterium]|nr:cellulose biosynthesis cyclic di-GMP-binding regulatory protein BcsB [Thermovirgaceae bacterium]
MIVKLSGSDFSRGILCLTFAGVLALGVLTTPWLGECSVNSIRTGLQLDGARIVIDLDRTSEYSVVKTNSEVKVTVRTGSPRETSGNFPSNRAALSYRATSSGSDTIVSIALRTPGVSIKHFALSKPDRIVLDLSPERAAQAAEPKLTEKSEAQVSAPASATGTQGLVSAPGTYGKDSQTFNSTLTTTDISVGSVFSTQSFFVDISPTWKVLDGSYIHLVLSHSQTTNPKLSNIVVSVNNDPIYTIVMDTKNVWKGEIKIPVSPEYFGEGTNTITLNSYMRSIDEQCQDIDNPGNWMRIHRESFVHMRYLPRSDLRLMNFTSPFFENNLNHKDNSVIVIPDDFEPAEAEAAFDMLISWARKSRFKDFRPRVVPASAVTPEIASTFHIIYIGRKDKLPKTVLESFGTPDSIKGLCYLSSFLNSFGKGRLLITAETSQGVRFGVRAMMLPELKEQMNVRKLSLALNTPLPQIQVRSEMEAELPFSEVFTGDVVFRGTYSHEQFMSFRIPPQWELEGTPQIVLRYRHSPVLNARKSALTVDFDDVPRKSVPLGITTSEEGRLVVPVPKDLKGGDFLNFNMRAYLDIDTFDCGHNFTEAAWLVVDKSSYLHLPHSLKRVAPLLEFLPYAISDKTMTVYLSPNVSGSALTSLGHILINWQQSLLGDLSLTVKSLASFSWDKPEGHSVIVAPVSEIVAKGIPISVGYDAKNARIISGQSVPVVPEFGESAAIFQLLAQKDSSLSLVMGWARTIPDGEMFNDALVRARLRGDVCLVSPDGRVIPFYLETPEPEPSAKTPQQWYEKILERFRGDRTTVGIFALGTSLVLFVLFVSLVRSMRKR